MAYGVTADGFKKKRLVDIKAEIEASLIETFGDTISLIPQSVIGQFVGIMSERESNEWEQLEAVYNSFYPSTAQGDALSELVLLNGIERQTDETDVALRIRREISVGALGNNILDSLYGQLLNLTDVVDVYATDNKTDITDSKGIPPHQFLCVVQGGTNQDIGDTIWRNTPQGINSYGTETVTVVDAQGYNQDVFFSRPTEVPIYFEINVTINSLYPIDGALQIQEAIVAYAESLFTIGDDIIHSKFYVPINSVEGIDDIELFIGLSASPTGIINIPIAITELGTFSTANIIVNEV